MLWNMRMKAIPTVYGSHEMAPKGVEKGREELEIRGGIKSIKTTAMLRLVRIQSSFKPEETCGHSDSRKKTGVKNLQGMNDDA